MDGGTGNDYLFGEDGDDTIYGGSGENYTEGGTGDDTIYGGDDLDYILGGDGNDTISGGNGTDYIEGNEGNDTINGDDGDDDESYLDQPVLRRYGDSDAQQLPHRVTLGVEVAPFKADAGLPAQYHN